MIPPPICDLCADPIELDKSVMVSLTNVMLAAPHRVLRQLSPWHAIDGTERRDDFQLCQECGGQLSLALFSSRNKIKVVIAKLEENDA